MERMNEYHGNRKHANTSSSVHTPPGMTGPEAGAVIREQDQYMPIANVIRIMRRILPAHAKISDDAKETIQECVSEYISFVTGEANDRCQREQRKTVTAEDVLWAMSKLGFDDYVPPLTVFLNRYRANNNNPDGIVSTPGNDLKCGIAGPAIDPYAGPGAFGMGPYHGMMFDAMGPGGPGYYPGGGGVGGPGTSSSSAGQNGRLAGYDPFAQFK